MMSAHSKTLRATVVVVTWNRREVLERVIESLLHQSLSASEYEIIVCDSNSTDGTKDIVADLIQSHVSIRYLNVELNNPAVKRNAGIQAANAEIVILLDDDAVPAANFVAAHIEALQSAEGAVVCGQIRYPAAWIKHSNYFRYRDSRHLGPTRPEISNESIPPWMITTMNMSFRKEEIISRVGYLSEEFQRYGGEDVEFGFRISKAGFRLLYVPQARITHYEFGGTIRKYFRKLYVSARDSAPILFRLEPGFLEATKARYLEHIYTSTNPADRVLKVAAQLCASRLSVRFVIRVLDTTDHLSWFYSRFAFFYLTCIATLAGIRDRSQKPHQLSYLD